MTNTTLGFTINNMKTWIILPILFLLIISTTGCAIHYYDEDTETEHLWGFGHMKMRVTVPEEKIQAAVHGIKICGLGISKTPEDFSLITGFYNKTKMEIAAEDASFRLEWPTNDLFYVRVGKSPPFLNAREINKLNKLKKGSAE